MTLLGHKTFHLHGEDRGAEFAYALAATERERVRTLSFSEMLLSGEGLEEWSNFTPENVASQFNLKGVWVWHIPFFWIPHLPGDADHRPRARILGVLDQGRDLEPERDHQRGDRRSGSRSLSAPGGLRGCLETYRAGLKNARINAELKKKKLTLPILTIGAPEFFGELVARPDGEGFDRRRALRGLPGVRAQPGARGARAARRNAAGVHARPKADRRRVLTPAATSRPSPEDSRPPPPEGGSTALATTEEPSS